jgi:23S rRNA (cytidine1920-2'-O)/16S rRNA (cytidine1409-2'-O)-methyltransferase
VDWIVTDVSFISLEKALPVPLSLARKGAILVALIKPQFEVGRAYIGKGGIVRDQAAKSQARDRIEAFLQAEGWQVINRGESPIKGGDGNEEYLVAARRI